MALRAYGRPQKAACETKSLGAAGTDSAAGAFSEPFSLHPPDVMHAEHLSHSRDPADTLRSIRTVSPSRRLAVCRHPAQYLHIAAPSAHHAFRLTPASTHTPANKAQTRAPPCASLRIRIRVCFLRIFIRTSLYLRAFLWVRRRLCVLYLLGIYLTPLDCLTRAERPHLQNRRPHPNRVGVLPPRRVPRLAVLPAVLGGPLRLRRIKLTRRQRTAVLMAYPADELQQLYTVVRLMRGILEGISDEEEYSLENVLDILLDVGPSAVTCIATAKPSRTTSRSPCPSWMAVSLYKSYYDLPLGIIWVPVSASAPF
ncbi:hypothetical protein K438DRAFT_1984872 [Mycena galopus ATCC 62051]|nr:hypothetical protein K438DRAFT_1984872 [Mycena galopus ATCC 62051]